MRSTARQARATTRNRVRQARATRRAVKAVATGAPQTARTHLVAKGLDDATAKRYAGAFSRYLTATEYGQQIIKLKGRRTKEVSVKLYDLETFAEQLSSYRPHDKAAAAKFAAIDDFLAA